MHKHHEAATTPCGFDTFTCDKFLNSNESCFLQEFQVSQGAVSRGWQLELGRKRMLQMDELDSNSGLNHWLHLSLEWQAIESLEIV